MDIQLEYYDFYLPKHMTGHELPFEHLVGKTILASYFEEEELENYILLLTDEFELFSISQPIDGEKFEDFAIERVDRLDSLHRKKIVNYEEEISEGAGGIDIDYIRHHFDSCLIGCYHVGPEETPMLRDISFYDENEEILKELEEQYKANQPTPEQEDTVDSPKPLKEKQNETPKSKLKNLFKKEGEGNHYNSYKLLSKLNLTPQELIDGLQQLLDEDNPIIEYLFDDSSSSWQVKTTTSL
jgi:hypothetical protein